MKKILSIVITLCLVFSLFACTKKENKYEKLEGSYVDSFSQRAVADVFAKDDHIEILVSWGSSVSETYQWTMTAKFTDDKTLSYEDEEASIINFDEKGNDTKTVLSEGGKGYFTLEDGNLLWNGSADESCKDCIFVYEEHAH